MKEKLYELFSEYRELVQQRKCPFCKEDIAWDEFRDELSRKEFKLSGLCQKCQDEVFGE